jgi:flagellar biosynthesis chaperone FliJ
MAVSRALRRLLRIRDLEEEQKRLALESALGELHSMEQAMDAAESRSRRGRRLVGDSAHSGALPDRLAGLEETRAAGRHATALEPRFAAMEDQVAELREAFLAKRVERRQAETLIEETEAQEAIAAGRRSQQSLDDWYRSRTRPDGPAKEN